MKDSEEITEPEMTDEQVDEAVESLLDGEIISGGFRVTRLFFPN